MSVVLPSNLSRPRPRREDFRQFPNYALARLAETMRGPLRWWCSWAAGGVAPVPPEQWRRGVIIGPNHIGDVLYNTPSLPALRAGLPNCTWAYAVSGPSAQVLAGNPFLDEVISIEDPGGFPKRLANFRAALAPRKFDVALTYAGGTAWQDLAIAAASGIPNRIGYVHKGFSGLTTHPVSLRFPQPFPAYFRDLVCQLIGQPPDIVPSLQPLVYPGSEHREAVDRLSAQWGLDWNRQPVLACAVTSRQPYGIWPKDRFLETVRRVREQENCAVIFFGAKSDGEELRALAAPLGDGTYVVAGELDLRAVVALLQRCRAALTPDSGPRHLANAAGVPVVFLRNLFNREIETGAYCATDHDMVPSGIELVDPAQQAAAFARIKPEQVAARLVELLRS